MARATDLRVRRRDGSSHADGRAGPGRVERLALRLDTPAGHGGRPLTRTVDVVPGPDGRSEVTVDFGSTGSIRFVCDEATIVEPE